MKAEWINPFITATVSVFGKMLNCEITRATPATRDGCQPLHEVSGIMGLQGNVSGTVVVSLSREAAVAATETMMGSKPTGIDADVIDVVGEITNMVAGAAKAQLEELSMRIGLPTVITGKSHILNFPRGVTVISIPFDSPWGALSVDVGLKETGVAVAATA